MNGGFWLRHLPEILGLVCTLLIVLGLFPKLTSSARNWLLGLRKPKVESSALRDSSHGSWEWMSRWTGKWKGYARTLGLASVCIFAIVMFATVPLQHQIVPVPTKTGHWWYFPYVPEKMPGNEYWVLHMDKNDSMYGTRSRVIFCKEPDIDEGEMVKDAEYRDFGDCVELLKYNYETEAYYPYNVKKYSKEYPQEAMNANR